MNSEYYLIKANKYWKVVHEIFLQHEKEAAPLLLRPTTRALRPKRMTRKKMEMTTLRQLVQDLAEQLENNICIYL